MLVFSSSPLLASVPLHLRTIATYFQIFDLSLGKKIELLELFLVDILRDFIVEFSSKTGCGFTLV